MLLRMLKSLARSADGPRSDTVSGGAKHDEGGELPVDTIARLKRAYASAPVDMHLEIAYGGMKIGDHDLVELVQRGVADSASAMPRRKLLHRPLASFFLAQYYLYSLSIEGARAECGVFSGTSALIACRAAQTRIPTYSGEGLHLVDSFEGLADPTEEDRFEGRENTDASSYAKGAYAAPINFARTTLAGFPGVAFHQGWIPAVFEELPACKWSFVHLDVDHYAPTYAGLHYFYPRLSPGGVIICDDYGSPTFPGAQRAWHRYCDENAVPFVVLDTGQSVILRAS